MDDLLSCGCGCSDGTQRVILGRLLLDRGITGATGESDGCEKEECSAKRLQFVGFGDVIHGDTWEGVSKKYHPILEQKPDSEFKYPKGE
jgi:hypothetical protein